MQHTPNLSLKSIEESYRDRAPAKEAPARERLLYHLGRFMEFTWNANAYARVKANSRGPRRQIGGLVKTDVFLCVQASAKLLNETIAETDNEQATADFRKCWFALAALLQNLEKRFADVEDLIARRAFFLLFVGARILRQSLNDSSQRQFLKEGELFGHGTFGLPEDERNLLSGLPVSPFEGGLTSTTQLEAVQLNCRFLEQALGSGQK